MTPSKVLFEGSMCFGLPRNIDGSWHDVEVHLMPNSIPRERCTSKTAHSSSYRDLEPIQGEPTTQTSRDY